MAGSVHGYHFVPYHYGPFAKNLYADLKILQDDDLVNVENGDEHRTRITLSDRERVAEALAELPEEVQEDIDAILDAYGDLDHNKLLKTVYKKYPAYARKSRLHRTRPR